MSRLLMLWAFSMCSVHAAIADVSSENLADHSHLKTQDALSMEVRQFYAALQERNYPFFEGFFADTVRANINGQIIRGKEQYISRLKHLSKDLFSDAKWAWLHVHTNYFANDALGPDSLISEPVKTMPKGTIWSNSWTLCTMKGNYTGALAEIEMHLDFKWLNGKVVEVLGYYDPTYMNEEEKAWLLQNTMK